MRFLIEELYRFGFYALKEFPKPGRKPGPAHLLSENTDKL